ncbi:hypothetical protein RHGRI_006375 [Rhododendron griersonianum]|uniref:Integrase catalytic domain-containing protein n=1 Tax=Rhododendron griersonianum TaxID=479676 RepID=A0AAV6KUI9_9ERIC|nr:hypothetical protein RHGRI_006375 [Rhododendron griersonianum]
MKHLNEREEKVRLGQFLFGLNGSYSTVRGHIMMMQPLLTVKHAYSLLCEEEKQRGLVEHKSIDQTHAMHVKTHPHFKQQGADTQRHADSRPWTSSSKSQGSKKPLLCSYCDGTTHTVERCYYLIGFPIGHKLHGKDVQPPNRNRKIAANQIGTEPSHVSTKTAHTSDPSIQFTPEELSQIKAFFCNGKNPPCANYAGISTPFCSSSTLQNSKYINWIIDSGATNHIASSITSASCVPISSQVSLPNGSHAKITGVGSTHLLHDLHVKDVLCVPSFHMNLLSVSQLTSDLNCSIQFFPTFCILQDLATKRMIGLGKQHKGLYYLVPLSEELSPSPASHHVSSPSDITWHQRLGHPSKGPSFFLSKQIPSFMFASQHLCEICPLAKQTRLSFPLSSIQSMHSFDLIHCDIWGPHRVPTHTGAHYFLTIVDDFTRFTWIFLMKFKSETQGLLKSFIAFVNTQFNCQIKCVRSDNGLEFTSLKSFFSTLGILFQSSCTSTPQQNGVVERKHRHLLNVGRALRFQANLPLKFWGESVLTATYLINRLPTPVLHHKSPFELLYNKPPTYTHLRVFGCLCYATNLQPFAKFSPRARRCIFVGYPTGQKAYRVYDIAIRQIFSSRDVIFHEQVFPFFIQNLDTQPDSLPLP